MEANKNQWLKDIGFDDSAWPDQYKSCMPSAVCFEYDYLRTLAKDGNMYGVLLQIRDIFETLMKIPCIMGIIILDHDHADCADGFNEVMSCALQKPMAMGDWYTLAGKLTKRPLKKITKQISECGRSSDYDYLKGMIDVYLQYYFCLSDPENAKQKRIELIQLIRSMENGKDPETIQILEYIISDFENKTPEYYINRERKYLSQIRYSNS